MVLSLGTNLFIGPGVLTVAGQRFFWCSPDERGMMTLNFSLYGRDGLVLACMAANDWVVSEGVDDLVAGPGQSDILVASRADGALLSVKYHDFNSREALIARLGYRGTLLSRPIDASQTQDPRFRPPADRLPSHPLLCEIQARMDWPSPWFVDGRRLMSPDGNTVSRSVFCCDGNQVVDMFNVW
jgi:hypothetical protein